MALWAGYHVRRAIPFRHTDHSSGDRSSLRVDRTQQLDRTGRPSPPENPFLGQLPLWDRPVERWYGGWHYRMGLVFRTLDLAVGRAFRGIARRWVLKRKPRGDLFHLIGVEAFAN